MVSEDLIWAKQIAAEQDRQGVLAYIVAEKVVTIETLVESFPWLRWGKLFSLLGVLLQEGFVTLQQRGFVFEVRIKTIGEPEEAHKIVRRSQPYKSGGQFIGL